MRRAFLRQVYFRLAGNQLEAHGVVAGSTDRPLDLYLLAQNQCQAYQQIETTAFGQPFTLTAQFPAVAADAIVRCAFELVNGSVVWYVVEGTVAAGSVSRDDSSYS